MVQRSTKGLLIAPDNATREEAAQLAADIDRSSRLGATVGEMLEAVAQGDPVVIVRPDREVSPAVAAEMLGVSRQFVDRLLGDGTLAFHRLPGSTHRRIRGADVLALIEERQSRHQGAESLRAAPGGEVSPDLVRHQDDSYASVTVQS